MIQENQKPTARNGVGLRTKVSLVAEPLERGFGLTLAVAPPRASVVAVRAAVTAVQIIDGVA
jgi:DNA-directed RNA polymerase subunit alpha